MKDGIEILRMARDGELKPKTILKTKHIKEYFDDRDYDYYIYYGDNQFHRCNENGKLGSKFQNRFLNYEVLKKEFELIEPKEIKNIEEKYFDDGFYTPEERLNVCMNKLDELIDEVNKLKKGE